MKLVMMQQNNQKSNKKRQPSETDEAPNKKKKSSTSNSNNVDTTSQSVASSPSEECYLGLRYARPYTLTNPNYELLEESIAVFGMDNYDRVDVGGDGNCLWYSFGVLLRRMNKLERDSYNCGGLCNLTKKKIIEHLKDMGTDFFHLPEERNYDEEKILLLVGLGCYRESLKEVFDSHREYKKMVKFKKELRKVDDESYDPFDEDNIEQSRVIADQKWYCWAFCNLYKVNLVVYYPQNTFVFDSSLDGEFVSAEDGVVPKDFNMYPNQLINYDNHYEPVIPSVAASVSPAAASVGGEKEIPSVEASVSPAAASVGGENEITNDPIDMKSIQIPNHLFSLLKYYPDGQKGISASEMENNEAAIFVDHLPKVGIRNDHDTDLNQLRRNTPKATPHGCCVFAGHVITGVSLSNFRHTLRDNLNRLECDRRKDYPDAVNPNCSFGCIQKDHYHVSVLVSTLESAPYNYTLRQVEASDYMDKLYQDKKGGTFLVIGRLNWNFQTYRVTFKPGMVEDEDDPDCVEKVTHFSSLFRKKDFGRLIKIKGEHDDKVLHTIVVKNGRLHCANLIGKDKKLFSAPAKMLLPMGKDKEGSCRILAKKPMGYLTDIRRVYEVCISPTVEINKGSRYAFIVRGNVFSVGMIDLPDDFSVNNYDITYRNIYKTGYQPSNCVSAPMSILGSTAFSTHRDHMVDGIFVPRLNHRTREGTAGWKMLQLPSLRKVAKIAESEVLKHLRKHDRETFSKVLLSRLLVPDHLRICGTIFSSVALVGDLSDNHNHRHRDKGDLCSIFITLGKGIQGGSSLYWGGKHEGKGGIVLHREEFCHGKFQVGPFDKVDHAGENWTGPRGVMAFYMNKKIYYHFLERDNQILSSILA